MILWAPHSLVGQVLPLTSPISQAIPEQLQALHALVVRTSPIGSILARPLAIETELIPTVIQ